MSFRHRLFPVKNRAHVHDKLAVCHHQLLEAVGVNATVFGNKADDPVLLI